MLLDTHDLLLTTSYVLLTTCYFLLPTYYSPLATCYLLLPSRHLLRAALRTTCDFQRAAHCSLQVGEYLGLIEGPGQEPVNSVFYKNYDDQYASK